MSLLCVFILALVTFVCCVRGQDLEFGQLGFDPLAILKTKCKDKTGSDAAFAEGMLSVAQGQTCLKEVGASVKEELTDSNDLVPAVRAVCRKSPELLKCMLQTSLAFETCMEPEEIRRSKSSINSTMEFLCENNGERLVEFVSDEGVQCFVAAAPNMLECYKRKLNVDSFATIIRAIQESSATPNHENCRLYKQIRTCAVQEMAAICHKQKPVQLLESFFKNYEKDLPCNKASSAILSVFAIILAFFASTTTSNIFW